MDFTSLHSTNFRWKFRYTVESMDTKPMNKVKVKVKSLSRVQLFATPWTVAYQAPPSMGFSGQEYWSGLPFPSPGDLPDPGIKPWSPAFQADTLTSEPPGKSLNAKKQTGYPQSSESCVTHPLLKHLTEIAPMSECPRGYLIGFCSLNKYQSGL